MIYNWQQPDWPNFRYEVTGIEDFLFEFAEETGHVSGMLKSMPDDLEVEAMINIMVTEAIKTSEIEGEYLSRQDVVSSIKRNLGLGDNTDLIKDKKAQGAAELMIDVRKTYADALTEETLFAWHKMLMRENHRIKVGSWREHTDPMQIVSGAMGKEKVHFEAPPSSRVPEEMKRFIEWFNNTAPGRTEEIRKAPIRSAIAHLYFETIHPFEDGNGRIGRAIAEKALSQTLGRPVLLSLSRVIEADKKSYYAALEQAQRGNEITAWVEYFVDAVLKAQKKAKEFVDFILKKSKFFEQFKNVINDRQLKVIRRMLDAGPEGFEGGMNANKYISITKTSKATATRDLQNLLELKIFQVQGSGKNTRYSIAWMQ